MLNKLNVEKWFNHSTQEKIMAWIKPLKSFAGYLSADSLYVANDFFSAKKWLRIRQIYANI